MSANQPSPQRPEQFRPPLLSLILAAGLGYLTHKLYLSGTTNSNDWAVAASMLTGVWAVMNVIKALKDRDILRAYRKQHKLFVTASKAHGTARQGTAEDLQQSEDFA